MYVSNLVWSGWSGPTGHSKLYIMLVAVSRFELTSTMTTIPVRIAQGESNRLSIEEIDNDIAFPDYPQVSRCSSLSAQIS